jgi:hypothetical protein
MILLEGINDIGFSAMLENGPKAGSATAVSAEDIIQGHKQIIERVSRPASTSSVLPSLHSKEQHTIRRLASKSASRSTSSPGRRPLRRRRGLRHCDTRSEPVQEHAAEVRQRGQLPPSDAGYRTMAETIAFRCSGNRGPNPSPTPDTNSMITRFSPTTIDSATRHCRPSGTGGSGGTFGSSVKQMIFRYSS